MSESNPLNVELTSEELHKGIVHSLRLYENVINDCIELDSIEYKIYGMLTASICLIASLNKLFNQINYQIPLKHYSGYFFKPKDALDGKNSLLRLCLFTEDFLLNDLHSYQKKLASIELTEALELNNDFYHDLQQHLSELQSHTKEVRILNRFFNQLRTESKFNNIVLEDYLNELLKYSHKITDSQLVPNKPSSIDHLGRESLVSAISSAIENTDESFTIGIFGDWGIGKSSFLAAVKERLQAKPETKDYQAKEKGYLFAEFNAWRYEQTDHLQSGMAQVMIERLSDIRDEDEVQKDKELKKQGTTVKHWLTKLLDFTIICFLSFVVFYPLLLSALPTKLAAISKMLLITTTVMYLFYNSFPELFVYKMRGIGFRVRLTLELHGWAFSFALFGFVLTISQLLPLDFVKEIINSAEIVKWLLPGAGLPIFLISTLKLLETTAANELKTYLRLPSYAKHLGLLPSMRENLETMCEVRLGNESRLLYIVEDLDRCRPDSILKVLEAVRLVLDLNNVTVVILVDQNIALAALAKHFSDIKDYSNKTPETLARDYLAKIIQLGITLQATNELQKFIGHSAQKPRDLPDLYGMSAYQVKDLISLTTHFGIHNPRSIIRLINIYKIIRHCFRDIEDNQTEGQLYPLLTNMIVIEWAMHKENGFFEKLTSLIKDHPVVKDKKKNKVELIKDIIELDKKSLNTNTAGALIKHHEGSNQFYFDLVKPFLLPHVVSKDKEIYESDA